jgi:N-acetylneuraminic acid mutarotase
MRPRLRHLLWIAAGLAGAGLLLAAAAGGFYAGRKVPRGLFARLSSQAARLPVWEAHPDAPFARFETAAIEVEGTILVFGGFHNAAIQASAEVWAYDTASRAWTRRGDMPALLTHITPARAGDRVWFAGGFLGDNPGTVTDQVWSYDWQNDRWSPGPPLPARVGSGALVALDDRLHYFGGYVEDFNTDSPHHWTLDPADSARGWVPRAPLPRARGHLGGAALAGRLYALGGNVSHDPDPLDVDWVDRYDPGTDRWTEAAPFPFPRSHFESATLIRDGRLIVVGGRGRPIGQESLDDVTEYDPEADRWLALPPLPEPRFAPLVLLAGGRMLAGIGGRETSNPDNRTLWLERTESAWQPVEQLPAVLAEVGGAVVWPRLYLLGGVEPWTLAFDLRTGHWDAPATHAVRPVLGDHHAVEAWNGRLYVFGALQPERGLVQIYDPERNLWQRGPPMPYGAGSVATALIGDRIYVAGGIVDDTTTRLSAVFDPATGTWSPMAPMPRGRNHTAAATDGRRLFVFGGRGPGSGDGNHLANGYADVQIYDPATDRWIASGEGPDAPLPLPQARGGMGKAVFAAGEFWVFGGETLDGEGANRRNVYDRVDVYDPAGNRWRSGPPLPTGRHGIFPLLLGDRIYVLGGGSQAGHSATLVAEVLDLRRAARRP